MTKECSVFFPEPMTHIGIVVPLESAAATIKILAENDLVHLTDENGGNQSANKRYTEEFIHCEEAERHLAFIRSQLEQYDLLPPPMSIQEFQRIERERAETTSSSELRYEIAQSYDSLRERIQRTQQLESQLLLAENTLAALRFFKPLLHERKMQISGETDNDRSSAFEMELLGNSTFLYSITGIVDTIKLRKLLVTFYRISRGNVVSQSDTCPDDTTKSFFTVWFQTESILRKLCSISVSYGAEVFEFPAEDTALDKRENELVQQIFESRNVLKSSYSDNKQFLLHEKDTFWFKKLYFTKEKQMFEYMDYADFETVNERAIYRGWVPTRRLDELQPLLQRATEQSGSPIMGSVETDTVKSAPPTFIQTNEFTEAFQLFNDSYGYANHDEVNGGAFYCMYPFLFGIMFGDIGHSFIYLLVALAIFYLYPKIKNSSGDMFQAVLSFRYFLLFMAICGIYCGFIYNECFGLPINFFGSHYAVNTTATTASTVFYGKTDASVYPFGVDPVWMFKDNELTFLNSLKMKLSIIMGILQMVFGMALAFIKHFRRRDWLELLLVWTPQILYLLSFFGYMVVLIIYKWCTANKEQQDGVNLIQVLISMLLNFGDDYKPGDELYLYPHQKTVQNAIALIFVLTIPVLLFAKPIAEIAMGHAHNGVLEVMVMNLIDVIEYCLSALSHTASYLRLWALSLAHSQLSHVLYEQVFMTCLTSKNVFLFFCGWAVFAVGTLVILLGMECFSSLLHAIRLMWVEFSSKFYTGQGYPFMPLSFRKACSEFGVQ